LKKGFLQNINAKRYQKIINPYSKADMLNRKFLNERTPYLKEKSLPVRRKSKCENKKMKTIEKMKPIAEERIEMFVC
jgi:hypothetical protein